MSSILVKDGALLDPAEGIDMRGHIAARDGVIVYIGDNLGEAEKAAGPDAERFDAAGLMVTPGFIDIHVHFREPGNEAQETIESGSRAAVAGGFATVVCMANTDPVLDTEADIIFTLQNGEKVGLANIRTVGAVTVGRKGEELAEMAQMRRGGAVAFSDDGAAVPSAGLLRRALSYAKMFNCPILEHCEDKTLLGEGVMDDGYYSTLLGLRGIPDECEEIVVARDVALARLTGGHIHIQHVSTANSVEIIRRAKQSGVRVTAEVTPHHLTLTSELVTTYDPVYKVNPPLRTRTDVEACRRGLKDGTLDAIASDHAPHLEEEKELEFAQAPCGMIGLESVVGVISTALVQSGEFTWKELLPAFTSRPSDILGLGRGRLRAGLPADLTVIDPEMRWTIDKELFQSRSRNCPFDKWPVVGRAVATIVGGAVKFRLPDQAGA